VETKEQQRNAKVDEYTRLTIAPMGGIIAGSESWCVVHTSLLEIPGYSSQGSYKIMQQLWWAIYPDKAEPMATS
jgi:hypothetical protein